MSSSSRDLQPSNTVANAEDLMKRQKMRLLQAPFQASCLPAYITVSPEEATKILDKFFSEILLDDGKWGPMSDEKRNIVLQTGIGLRTLQNLYSTYSKAMSNASMNHGSTNKDFLAFTLHLMLNLGKAKCEEAKREALQWESTPAVQVAGCEYLSKLRQAQYEEQELVKEIDKEKRRVFVLSMIRKAKHLEENKDLEVFRNKWDQDIEQIKEGSILLKLLASLQQKKQEIIGLHASNAKFQAEERLSLWKMGVLWETGVQNIQNLIETVTLRIPEEPAPAINNLARYKSVRWQHHSRMLEILRNLA
ncbi:hypothetical protein T439DRAFT_351720 [Meredithblackwellia eburnea MCA 4105]